jgi:Thiamine pyrophosphate enzyme, C-terminal TPP binding domain
MSFNEILTCVRDKIPISAVVFNNRQWGAEKKNQVDFYSERFLCTNLENPSFAAIARTMGAEGHGCSRGTRRSCDLMMRLTGGDRPAAIRHPASLPPAGSCRRWRVRVQERRDGNQ